MTDNKCKVEFEGYIDKCKHCNVEDVRVLAVIKKGHRTINTIWVDRPLNNIGRK